MPIFRIFSQLDSDKCLEALKDREVGSFIVAVEDGQFKICVRLPRSTNLLHHQ